MERIRGDRPRIRITNTGSQGMRKDKDEDSKGERLKAVLGHT